MLDDSLISRPLMRPMELTGTKYLFSKKPNAWFKGDNQAITGGAAQFTATDKTYLVASGVSVQTPLASGGLNIDVDDFAITGWFNFDSIAVGSGIILSKGGYADTNEGYEIFRDGSTLKASISKDSEATEFDSSQYTHLKIEDAVQTGLDFGRDDFSLSGWAKFDSIGAGTEGLLSKGISNGFSLYRDTDALKCDINVAPSGAAQFTATDKTHLTISDATQSGLDFATDDFSISLWVSFSSVAAGNRCILHKGGTDAGTTGYEVFQDGSSLKTNLSVNSQLFTATIGTGMSASTWYHVAIACDRDGNITGYLNGSAGTPVDISAQVGQTVSNSTDFYVGSRAGSDFCGMSICALSLYNRILSADEIDVLYDTGPLYYRDLYDSLKTNLVSFWDFDESVIDTTNDCIDKVGSNNLGFVAAELVTNGTFDADTDWDKDANWSISGGVASCTGGGGANKYIYQSGLVTIGNIYATSYQVTAYTSGLCRIRITTSSRRL